MIKHRESSEIKIFIFVLIALFLLICIFTFPLFLNANKMIPGFHSSDESFAVLWYGWRIKHAFLNHLSLTHTDFIAYPYGVDLYSTGVIAYVWIIWTHFLSLIFSPALSYNIQSLVNMVLSFIFVYLLMRHLLGKKIIAPIVSGIIFAFSPYQLVRTWQHLSLSYNQWLVLIILAAILLRDKLCKRNIIFFFLASLLLFTFDFSIMYLGSVALFTFIIYVFLHACIRRKELSKERLIFYKTVFMVLFSVFMLVSWQFFPIFKKMLTLSKTTPSAHNLYHRPFEDLFAQSARPLSYFLPSSAHPVFGKITEQFIGSQLYGNSFTEHTLYLGWTPLILAFVAVKKWRKRKELSAISYQLSATKENFYIGFFIFLAIVAWFFSQPPWWQFGPLKIYMPSFFMYKVLPMYRAYCRFGIVMMLAVSVLAGFGLKFVLDRAARQKTKIAIAVLFCALVLFEFWSYPPFKVIDVSSVPEVYSWLKLQQGNFAVGEYPLDADSPNELYKLYQTTHEKKIINGTIPGTYANKVAQTITKLSDAHTAGLLKWMGVRYVLVHHQGYLQTGLITDTEELRQISENSGLNLIKSFSGQECLKKGIMCVLESDPIDVYQVSADPIKPGITAE